MNGDDCRCAARKRDDSFPGREPFSFVLPVYKVAREIAILQVFLLLRQRATFGPPSAQATPNQTTLHADLQALRETGATGLEPATSGVTGRVGAPRRPAKNASEQPICRAFQLWRQAGTAWLSQSSNRRLGHEWATKSCLHGERSGWRTREIACAKTRIVFPFPSRRRCFVRADALALLRARPDATPRHAAAGGACLSSRRRPSRINPAVPSAA